MKTRPFFIALAVLALFTINQALSNLHAQGTAFTYQGRLNSGTNGAVGSYDLTFALFGVSSGAGQVGNTLTNNATAVSNGLFAVTLDFGNQFPGANRWLEIGVRTNGSGAFTTLAPRQLLTATPYAVTAGNLAGTLPATQLSGSLTSAQLSGTYAGAVNLNNAGNAFTGNGSGLTGLNAANLASGTVPDPRLSANVALRGGGNAFTSTQTITGTNTGSWVNSVTFIENKSTDAVAASPAQRLQAAGNLVDGVLSVSSTTGIGYIARFGNASGYLLDITTNGTVQAGSPINAKGGMRVDRTNIWFTGDANHGLGYFGNGRVFAGAQPDGPVLFGYSGGALGTEQYGTEKIALSWDANGNVTATNGPIKALGGLVIENRTFDPVNPQVGQIWLRTDLP